MGAPYIYDISRLRVKLRLAAGNSMKRKWLCQVNEV